jgi:RES domain-containing protein
MQLWRICRAAYRDSAFSGAGAEQTGGRWNDRGTPLVYASENLSLAALELFVHVAPNCLPDDLIAIRATLPDTVTSEELSVSGLPKSWREYPAPAELPALGMAWLRRGKSLVLLVPSAINPVERNILLNPAHRERSLLQIHETIPFRFDPRMFGK